MKDITTNTLYYLDHTGVTTMQLTQQQHDEFQGSGSFYNTMEEATATKHILDISLDECPVEIPLGCEEIPQDEELYAFAMSLADYDRSSAEHSNMDPDHQHDIDSSWIDPEKVYQESLKRYTLESMTPQQYFDEIPF